MSYEMSNLRKTDISLYNYIKNTVFSNFVETEVGVGLKVMPALCGDESNVYEIVDSCNASTISSFSIERGRGLVYFDDPGNGINCEPFIPVSGTNGDGDITEGTPEQSNRVAITSYTTSGTNEIVSCKDYMIDYVDGRIITPLTLSNPTITYTWNYVSIVDEWAAIQAANPPVIVIDMHGTDKSGYQLGGGRKVVRKADIHIFASDPAERNDIVEVIYNGLYNKSCPIYDFPTGSILDYDGTFYGRKNVEDRVGSDFTKLDYLFDRKKVENSTRINFENVTSRHVNLSLVMSRGKDELMLSDLNAYRSKVSFDVVAYQ